MEVDSDFTTTLLDNLKLEDPWLPPSSWESIPSESGPPLTSHSSSSHHPLRDASSVSEASLVRLGMNALQGFQSALMSVDKLSNAFCSDPADRTFHQIPSLWNRSSSTHAQGKILKSIGYSGFLVFLLRKFVDYFRNSNLDDKHWGMRQHEDPELGEVQDHHDGNVQEEENRTYSLVNHAFAVAVAKIIEGYVCALDTLYASVHLRHSSESAEMPLEACSTVGCLTTVVHSEITLLELYLHTKELRTQIEALGNLCNLYTIAVCFSESSFEDLILKAMRDFNNFFRGGDLLTYLYAQLQVADPPHRGVIEFLFLRSCEPYVGFIRSWIYKAQINDPYKEFIVECIDNLPTHQHGRAGMSTDIPLAKIRERDRVAVPCFLRDYLIPLIRAGQQLQVLMKLLELCTYVASEDLAYEDLLPSWSGFSSNHSFNAFPITLKKEDIEATTLARGSYYKRMQEKLGSLLTRFEFRYQQVVPHDSTTNDFGDGWNGSDAPVSFKLNESLMAPSAEDKRKLNVDTDDADSDGSSTMENLSYLINTHESSECSSSSDGEEKIVSEQLLDRSTHMVGIEQKYLSVLNFSMCPFNNLFTKLDECEESNHIDSSSDEIWEGKDTLDHYVQSHHTGLFLDQVSVAIESQEPNWSVNGLSKSSVLDGSYRDNSRSHILHGDPKVSNKGALNSGLSYYRKMRVMNDTLSEELFSEDEQENRIYSSNLFTLKHWKVDSHDNSLSINPVLARNTFLTLKTDPGEKDCTHGLSLPYFDFSSVEDPCKGCLENLSADFDSVASETSIKSDLRDKPLRDQDFSIDNAKLSGVNTLPDLKDCKQEVATSTQVSGGSSWESLLGRSSNTVFNNVRDCSESSLAKFDIPLDFIVDKCLLQEIMLQYKYVSKLTIKLLEEGFDFKEHLLALRRYHFMESADWADLFIMSLWNRKWCITEAEQRLAEIQGVLESSLQRSSCECDHNKDRLYVYMKGHETILPSVSTVGLHSFDFLGLGYRVDWPVSIVLTPGSLKIYSEIFSFLIKVKLAIFSLTDVWCSLKDLRPLTSVNQHAELRKQEVSHFNLLMKIRHQVNHFVSTLQQYVESQLSHVSWCNFLHSFQHKVRDMMDLESVHMAYLIDSLHICFLSNETRPVARIIESILQCSLDFRSCLREGMWNVGINQGDLAERLPRINVSQVLAIKKTFDQNLQELRVCYLKSPKHGEFGLSRFWGYLNYNEYYSDVGNEMRYYAFAL